MAIHKTTVSMDTIVSYFASGYDIADRINKCEWSYNAGEVTLRLSIEDGTAPEKTDEEAAQVAEES